MVLNEETSFPRGRTPSKNTKDTTTTSESSSNNRKKRSASHEEPTAKKQHPPEQDFLFGTATPTTTKKRTKKLKTDTTSTTTMTTTATSLLPLGGGGVVQPSSSSLSSSSSNKKHVKKEATIEALSFNKLAKGTKLLGIVRELQSDYAVLSLPNLLSGYILKKEKDPLPLTHVLQVGQVLAVVILKTSTETVGTGKHQLKRRRIQVSVLPASLNAKTTLGGGGGGVRRLRGQIKSVEDHGCLVDLGHGRSGFLQFDQITPSYTIQEYDDGNEEDQDDDDDNGAEEDSEDTLLLNAGRILDFSLSEKYDASQKIVSLSLPSRQKVSQQVLKPSPLHKNTNNNNHNHNSITLASLTPGALVECRIEALARNGLCVTFLGGIFRGSIELSHLGGYWIPSGKQSSDGSMEWKTHVFGTSGDTGRIHKVKARILCVDAATKIVRLSLLPHLLELIPPASKELPPVGQVVPNATVVRLDPGVGALLAFPPEEQDDDDMDNNDDDDDDQEHDNHKKTKNPHSLSQNSSYRKASKIRAAYVHISKAMDAGDDTQGRTPEGVFAKHFAPSTTHTCRILSTSNWIEGVASCATSESVVGAHVLTHADLQPGKVYRHVPVSSHLEGGGVIVNFGMGVRGLIPIQHLFDTANDGGSGNDAITGLTPYRAKLRRAKFALDAKVDVRVLEVDERHKRCILTAKKPLIQATDSLTTFEDAATAVGQQLTGFISNIDKRGLYVTFYNNVYGRVTARSLAAELGVENHFDDYHVGDVVKCRVVSCRQRENSKNGSTPSTTTTAGDEDDDEDEDNASTKSVSKFWDLNLSLNLNTPEQPQDGGDSQTQASRDRKVVLKAGAVIPPKCMKIVELVPSKPKESGGIIPGYAVVSIKSKYITSGEDQSSSMPYVECKLPFDQLADQYTEDNVTSAENLDTLAETLLTVGKKINQRGLVMVDPKKSSEDYATGIGSFPVVSLRPSLIDTAEKLEAGTSEDSKSGPLLPTHDTNLFMGAYVQGYVTRIDPRYGAFVRFLDNLTGLVPKLKKGLELPLYGTVTCRIMALDVTTRPIKILLRKAKSGGKDRKKTSLPDIKPGDKIPDAEVVDVNFTRATVQVTGGKFGNAKNLRARIHVTMGESKSLPTQVVGKKKKKYVQDSPIEEEHSEPSITKDHPFYKWKAGKKLSDLTCVAVDARNGVAYVELTNQESDKTQTFAEKALDLRPGSVTSAIVTFVPKNNRGLWVQMSPGVSGYVPALELSTDAHVLNNLRAYYHIGARIDCCVMDKSLWDKKKRGGRKLQDDVAGKKIDKDVAFLSSLMFEQQQKAKEQNGDAKFKLAKPLRGDLVVGQINRSIPIKDAPALMINLRGGFVGRCCITELEEVDEWINMPLGRLQGGKDAKDDKKQDDKNVVTDEEDGDDDDSMDIDPEHEEDEESVSNEQHQVGEYPHGMFVNCRVLAGIPSNPMVEVSLRSSRLEGDLDSDEIPEAKEMVQAFVVDTNKKGCFVRLSRQVEGRVILKELCDGFLHDPAASYPMGRLVVGKIKSVNDSSKSKKKNHTVKTAVDIDMRESVLLESKDKIQLEDVKVGIKHKGSVTRIESYGVFVRLENSNVSGLVHKSECSDSYVKNLEDLYDPGDLVKVLVVKVDMEQKRVGLSMKASHFKDDDDSDEESSIGSSMDAEDLDNDDDASSSGEDDAEMPDAVESNDSEDSLDSEDENYASKLAAKMQAEDADNDSSKEGSEDSDDDDSDDESSDDDDSEEEEPPKADLMDTDVGFDWGVGASSGATKGGNNDDSSSSSDDDSDDDDDEEAGKSGHKSRRKAAARRREEQEITRRETALADGTADENPETAADFERLLASDPNRSEHWIRYMAYHLSLADIQSARSVAERAFDRIEFRQEGEKLNVWTALLTLELKYGSKESLQETVDRACQHNNPKQVYLRVCEMLDKEVDASSSSGESVERADEMFKKMCKKFKSKKSVWIAHLQYLIKGGRHHEAHALLKRSLKSLPEYKHVETMSKFSQMEFEFGSPERGRTIFDGLLEKYPKRLDLLFVYVDKEIKNGEIDAARGLFEKTVQHKKKLSDKQMKSLFKKWYRIEETDGTDESREHVKNAARAYVERSSK